MRYDTTAPHPYCNRSNSHRHTDPDAEGGHPGAEQSRQHGQHEASSGWRFQEDIRRQRLSEKCRSSGGAGFAANGVLVSGMGKLAGGGHTLASAATFCTRIASPSSYGGGIGIAF